MAFTATTRVRVTSEHSQYRGELGTVLTAGADTASGLNEVRIDGHRNNHPVLLADNELGTTNFVAPITY